MVKHIDDLAQPSATHVMAGLGKLFQRGRDDLAMVGGARFAGLRVSVLRILDLIPPAGIRQTALAARANVTKQAMGQRLDDLVVRGWVTIAPDPADGRAHLVRLTATGRAARRRADRWVAEVELVWAAEVGEADYAVFRRVLDHLATESAPPTGTALTGR